MIEGIQFSSDSKIFFQLTKFFSNAQNNFPTYKIFFHITKYFSIAQNISIVFNPDESGVFWQKLNNKNNNKNNNNKVNLKTASAILAHGQKQQSHSSSDRVARGQKRGIKKIKKWLALDLLLFMWTDAAHSLYVLPSDVMDQWSADLFFPKKYFMIWFFFRETAWYSKRVWKTFC